MLHMIINSKLNNSQKNLVANLNVHEKIQKNILVFQYHLKKKLDNEETIKYKQNFIDSFRFMSTSLSKFVDNLSNGLHKDKCKYCKFKLSYMSVKDNQLIFQRFACEKNYQKDLDETSLLILKMKVFTKIVLMMLKNGSAHLTMKKMIKDHFQ